ncbi:endoplasmic reticulum lectin 1 isoform X3 [Glossina fuscipes]|uniref:Endoplasmic reticulum lectin 1 n=1 Tax=Glossina fuscipes TaxID=7396 RepID=A0A8U0WET0_9MUSC|nr:endoplasmic reticulum lectin 1 isoform X3 [Glossina fuscipes]
MLKKHLKNFFIVLLLNINPITTHEAKDFDDTILYKIDFEMPDFGKNTELKNYVRTFYTHEKEKYDCMIPIMEESRKEDKSIELELSPLTLLKPILYTYSYRIEAYWSYEICHGHYVRQYHEERDGKNVKFQEYYLGKWNSDETEKLQKEWEENRKANIKYKTTKIDNVKYPYFEMVLTDGTMCDIIDAPRTTTVRYVCYPHGKNDIYSFKETSSCNYEAIILTPVLCVLPAFHPEESKEISIKCFNSPTEPHKPLSMLRQELNELQLSEDDLPVPKEVSAAVVGLTHTAALGDHADTHDTSSEVSSATPKPSTPPTTPAISQFLEMSSILTTISGKSCLTGGAGWWKYEFCYGRHVRQFHKDKKSETELFLGHFNAASHRQWLKANPDKRHQEQSTSFWQHYEKGSFCDHTGLPREINVKFICSSSIGSLPVSMYLLEPKTCQYILVFESPMVCVLMNYIDEYGLIDEYSLEKMKQAGISATSPKATDEATDAKVSKDREETTSDAISLTSTDDIRL